MHRTKSSTVKTSPAPQRTAQNQLESIDDASWNLMSRRAAILRGVGTGPMTVDAARRIASDLNVHWTTVYRWRRRLSESGLITSLQGSPRRGFPRGIRRLSALQDQLLDEVIAKRVKRPALVRSVDLVDEVTRVCVLNRIAAPSRRTVSRRWREALVSKHANRKMPGTYSAHLPLDVVQIDHTVSDVFVVDDLYRAPIGRPYLTVALDIATRSIVAIVLGFDAPSAATVALCLVRLASPKDQWIEGLGLQSQWPMAGLPRSIHLDNAPEFHSKALQRGCAQFGIEIVHRPPGRPHFGGHIERGIGTLMSRFKSLPGATGSSTKDRKQRQPEEKATMTLTELERWLVIEIADRYHHKSHRGLRGATPFAAWAADLPAPLASDRRRELLWAFLPAVNRVVRREGIQFSRIRYWHPIFSQWAVTGETVRVHYDPRDLSRLFVVGNDGTCVEATFCDATHPPISIWESDAAAAHLRKLGQTALSESRLFAAIEEQRAIVLDSASNSRRARLQQARQRSRGVDRTDSVRAPEETIDSSADRTEIDQIADGDYSGEIWSEKP